MVQLALGVVVLLSKANPGAIAFIDIDGDGSLNTATEPYAFTDADGNYSIDTAASGDIVVITDHLKLWAVPFLLVQ